MAEQPMTIAEYLRRSQQPTAVPPVCECGRRGKAEGAYWVCRTPGCAGEGQVLKARLIARS